MGRIRKSAFPYFPRFYGKCSAADKRLGERISYRYPPLTTGCQQQSGSDLNILNIGWHLACLMGGRRSWADHLLLLT